MRLTEDNLDFKRIHDLGLDPRVKTEEQYLKLVAQGIERARAFLAELGQISVDPKNIRTLHSKIFSDLYPPSAGVAGEFTKRQIYIFGSKDEKFYGALPHQIEPRLADLHKVFAQRFGESKTEAQQIHTCVDFHVQFKAIQAFLDGNGRTASVFLEHQLSVVLKREIGLTLSATKYRDSMWSAVKEGKLGPIQSLITRAIEQASQEQTTARIAAPDSLQNQGTKREIPLSMDQVRDLSTGDVKRLLQNADSAKINGLTVASLKQEFEDRRRNEHAGAKDVKELLGQAVEQDKRHQQTFIPLKQDQTSEQEKGQTKTMTRSR